MALGGWEKAWELFFDWLGQNTSLAAPIIAISGAYFLDSLEHTNCTIKAYVASGAVGVLVVVSAVMLSMHFWRAFKTMT